MRPTFHSGHKSVTELTSGKAEFGWKWTLSGEVSYRAAPVSFGSASSAPHSVQLPS